MSRLEQLARDASQSAYAPYSHFLVGAAVQTLRGDIFTGANVENASYGLTLCAERVAIASAVASGGRQIVALAIYTPSAERVVPCGACLQVLQEFALDLVVSTSGAGGERQLWRLEELLPQAFRLQPPAP